MTIAPFLLTISCISNNVPFEETFLLLQLPKLDLPILVVKTHDHSKLVFVLMVDNISAVSCFDEVELRVELYAIMDVIGVLEKVIGFMLVVRGIHFVVANQLVEDDYLVSLEVHQHC
jgi:hypothetical protein